MVYVGMSQMGGGEFWPCEPSDDAPSIQGSKRPASGVHVAGGQHVTMAPVYDTVSLGIPWPQSAGWTQDTTPTTTTFQLDLVNHHCCLPLRHVSPPTGGWEAEQPFSAFPPSKTLLYSCPA